MGAKITSDFIQLGTEDDDFDMAITLKVSISNEFAEATICKEAEDNYFKDELFDCLMRSMIDDCISEPEWSFNSKTDPRWNSLVVGRKYELKTNHFTPEYLDKLAELTQLYGKPPKDLKWKYEKYIKDVK